MALVLTEEQQMLKTSAKELMNEKAPVAALRALRDERDETGFDKVLWNEMAEMGWSALTIPEANGGLGFGYVGLGQVLEEMGRTLTASPMVSTVLIGATAIQQGCTEEQKNKAFESIMMGSAIYALACDEQKHHDPENVETVATKSGDGYAISGRKTFVLDGHVADKFIVSASLDGDISLFIIEANAEGVNAERVIMMDSRNSSTVTFKDAPSAIKLSGGLDTLTKTLDIARIGLSAEMLGCSLEAFERTVAYLIERKQFGVAIGSFQGLQHRASKMFCELELLKSIVLKGLQAIDEDAQNLAELASMAKAKAGETVKLVTAEAVQMFGGIGMTDDEEIGFFLKRARSAQQTLGDFNFHLDRFARLNGY